MKKPKLALKYFIRLIELHDLTNRRNSFHRLYSGETVIESLKLIIHKYDADNEVAVWESKAMGSPVGRFQQDFGQEICDEVGDKSLKIKGFLLKILSSGSDAERGAHYRQVMTDIERLIDHVEREQVFARYPCIAAALRDIKEFVLAHALDPLETGSGELSGNPDDQIVGFHYRYTKENGRAENKALTNRFLGDLFYKLKDELELVAPDTSIDDFRAIFSGKIVRKPVVWIGTNKQLRYFYKAIENKLVPHKDEKIGKWGTVAACFIHRNGESFTAGQLQNTGASGRDVPRMREIEELGTVLR